MLSLGTGLLWRLEHPVVHPDYNAAIAHVAERHEPGDPIIVSLPAAAWLTLDANSRDDLYFLAGPEDRPRAERYTRRTAAGRLSDYGAGVDSIVSATDLRAVLTDHPNAWMVVDRNRLYASWAPYAGPMTTTIEQMTTTVQTLPGGALVLQPDPDTGYTMSDGRAEQRPGGDEIAEPRYVTSPARRGSRKQTADRSGLTPLKSASDNSHTLCRR